jgi:hypothetical protein
VRERGSRGRRRRAGVDGGRVEFEPLVAIVGGRRELQARERALARQCRAGIALAGERREQRVAAQGVVVGQVLVTEAQSEDALHRELARRVLDARGGAPVVEAAGEPLEDLGAPLRLAQEQGAAVRADRPTVETRHDLAPTGAFETERCLVILCHRRQFSFVSCRTFSHLYLRTRSRRVDANVVRDPG